MKKWGFGMAPISHRMQIRYDDAVRSVSGLLNGSLDLSEVSLEALSEMKGMFNRCVRKDQWDWFSVSEQLGRPSYGAAKRLAGGLAELRRSVKEQDEQSVATKVSDLIKANALLHLTAWEEGLPDHTCNESAGWVYVLSTREQPDLLKIGMTRRSVSKRVSEINSATGVAVPFAARAVYRVSDAARAERDVHARLKEYRLRTDREFFAMPFGVAAREIEKYLVESRAALRRTGRVLRYLEDKGYGFLCTPDGEVFFHVSQVPHDQRSQLCQGCEVEFDLGRQPQGLCALQVSVTISGAP